jgi:hypothetical protein
MNDTPHRSLQNLPKIGPIYSSIDEKQRLISEEILEQRLRPELKLKINMNIPGLERKKAITAKNVETYRFTHRLSHYGKEGWKYIFTSPNSVKFFYPFCGLMFYYYSYSHHITQIYNANEALNYEYETAYLKMQTFPGHYADKLSYMA